MRKAQPKAAPDARQWATGTWASSGRTRHRAPLALARCRAAAWPPVPVRSVFPACQPLSGRRASRSRAPSPGSPAAATDRRGAWRTSAAGETPPAARRHARATPPRGWPAAGAAMADRSFYTVIRRLHSVPRHLGCASAPLRACAMLVASATVVRPTLRFAMAPLRTCLWATRCACHPRDRSLGHAQSRLPVQLQARSDRWLPVAGGRPGPSGCPGSRAPASKSPWP